VGLVGLLFAAVTFPGLIVNGVVQQLFVDGYGAPTERIAVPEDPDEETIEEDPAALEQLRTLGPNEEPREGERVEYFTDYEAVRSYNNLLAIVLGPFFVTSILALVSFGACVGADMAGIIDRESGPLLWLAFFYPGFAIAAHSFPNSEPTNALFSRSRQTGSLLKVVGYPIVALSKLINLLRFLWIDALYAIFLCLVLAIPLGVI